MFGVNKIICTKIASLSSELTLVLTDLNLVECC